MSNTEPEKIDITYLLEKVYDKYQMEINRKDRLQTKISGYYTIIGIYFAAFLVIETSFFNNILQNFCKNIILYSLNCILMTIFLTLYYIIIVSLHEDYTPKTRKTYDPITTWDELKDLPKESAIYSLREYFKIIIEEYSGENENIASMLKKVNTMIKINIITIFVCFVILIISYFLK